MTSLRTCLLLLCGSLLLLAASSLISPPRQFYPVESRTGTDGLTVTAAGGPVSEASLCEDKRLRLRKFLEHVASGEDTGRCIPSPNSKLALVLSEHPLEHVSARIPDGVIVFEAASDGREASACKQAVMGAVSSTCTPAGQLRRWPSDQLQNYRHLHHVFNSALVVCSLLLVAIFFSAKRGLIATSFALSDAALLFLALIEVTWTRNVRWNPILGAPAPLQVSTVLMHGVLTLIVMAWLGLYLQQYSRRRPFWDEFSETLRVQATVFLLACTLSFLFRQDAARGTLLLVWMAALVLLPLGRAVVRSLLNSNGKWKQPAIILGVGPNAQEALRAICSEHNLGYEVFGFLRSGLPDEDLADAVTSSGLPVLNKTPVTPPGLVDTLQQLGTPKIIVAVDSLSTPEAALLIQTLAVHFDGIHVIPTIRGLPLFGTSLSHFFRHEVLFLTLRNTLHQKGLQALKRGFDLLGATAILMMLSPLLAYLSWKIWRSGGAPFYAHQRIGRNGETFGCLKFRSMRPDADQVLKALLATNAEARAEWDRDFKLKNDPRVTPIGSFLRKTSLDELPQLWNVLKGEMSLVGPRPIIQAELERYGEQAHLYLQVRPGITGLWQVSGRSDTNYAERVALDTWYVQNWSLWYDIAILFKTIDTVVGKRGAY